MEVENPALAVVMKRHDILAVGKVSVLVLIPVPTFQADDIELADEVVREFLPVSHRPVFRLFRGWGQFYSYRRILDTAMSPLLLPELRLMEHHPRPDGRGGETFGQVTDFHDLSQLLIG